MLAGGCSHRLLGPIRPLPIHPMTSPPSAAGRGAGADAGQSRKRPGKVAKHKWSVAAAPRAWKHIVIHHSASPGGNAATFDRFHRLGRGWDELGYHFVIDNGNGGPDGRVEIGSRWVKQKHGAHTGQTPENEYNEYGIGICLVGNFTARMPSRAQLASLNELVLYLARTYRITPSNVIGHRGAPGAATSCPGDRLNPYIFGTLRPTVARELAKPPKPAGGRR